MSEMPGGGGGGAIQQAMLQTKIAGDGKGGVAAVSEVVKGLDTHVISAQTGNVDQISQQFGSACGVLSGNVSELVGFVKDANAFGMPSIVGEVQQLQQELGSKGYAQINIGGEPMLLVATTENDLHAQARMGSDLHQTSAREGLALFSAGVSGFQSHDPGLLVTPHHSPAISMRQTGQAMGGH